MCMEGYARAMAMVAALLGPLTSCPAHAQDSGPIRILVGAVPGGAADLIGRMVATAISEPLGSTVIVDNRPGANGAIAAEALKNAAPDGKTLMIAPSVITVFAPLTHSNLRYDPLKDFAPVALAANYEIALVASSATPASNLKDYLAWVRTSPANGAYGVPGTGGVPHFFGVMLGKAAKVELTVVPYKGGGALAADLVAGHVPAGIIVISEIIRQRQAGKVRILAVSGAERLRVAADVPTFKELGYPALQRGGWYGFHAPANTPRPVIERTARALSAALNSADARERLLALGLEPAGGGPRELAERVEHDIRLWTPVIKASGFRAD